MVTLTTKSGRLINLRPPQAGDVNILYHYARDLGSEDTFILLNPDLPVTLAEETDYLASCLKKMAANWQVHYLAFQDDRLIGSCQVTVQGRRKLHVGAFGISLLKPYRQDGLGGQLARWVIHEAQTKMHSTLITLEVFANNQVALRFYRQLGFVEYGRLPGGIKYRDQSLDAVLMYLKCDEA
ncbi:hypothetical protein A2W24_01490 [Microgenomates group bacterium RBG_16_45_19]|nr:MAG: hypothetical protein A2W24_01490 [Microgenomates group bacterium RBG_16_45_19]